MPHTSTWDPDDKYDDYDDDGYDEDYDFMEQFGGHQALDMIKGIMPFIILAFIGSFVTGPLAPIVGFAGIMWFISKEDKKRSHKRRQHRRRHN